MEHSSDPLADGSSMWEHKHKKAASLGLELTLDIFERPAPDDLSDLESQKYSVLCQNIQRVVYEKEKYH